MTKLPLSDISIQMLAKAIRDLHDCTAVWKESVQVKETFQGKTVWDRDVQAFSIWEHPTASRCYAWSYVTDEKLGKRKSLAILHQDPVDSPQAAVRAAIVADYREKTS